jgi:hypothetical protein
LNLAIASEEDQQNHAKSLVQFLETSLACAEKFVHHLRAVTHFPFRAEILENRFPLFLSASFLKGCQDSRAAYYAFHCADRFLEQWASLHPLMAAARMDALRVKHC